jgi:hypothetical protein
MEKVLHDWEDTAGSRKESSSLEEKNYKKLL